jgi:TPR repeat protein
MQGGDLTANPLRAAAVVLLLAASTPARADDAAECSRDALALANFGRAFDACRRWADSGSPLAEYNLGEMYNRGLGVPRDYAEGSVWLRRAADQGFAPAEAALGRMFQQGDGMSANPVEAAKWYRRAAEQGYAPAQRQLGIEYFAGRGVPQDDIAAYMWLTLTGAGLGATGAAVREAVARRMTRAQIEAAEELVREWKPAPR